MGHSGWVTACTGRSSFLPLTSGTTWCLSSGTITSQPALSSRCCISSNTAAVALLLAPSDDDYDNNNKGVGTSRPDDGCMHIPSQLFSVAATDLVRTCASFLRDAAEEREVVLPDSCGVRFSLGLFVFSTLDDNKFVSVIKWRHHRFICPGIKLIINQE